MSNMLIGVREHDIPSKAEFAEKLDEVIGHGESREALFGQSAMAMMTVAPRDDSGFFLCDDGVIRPRALEGMVPHIVSQPSLLREFAQDAMRMLLRDYGIVVKLHEDRLPKQEERKGAAHTTFLRVSCEDIQSKGAERVHSAIAKWLAVSPNAEHSMIIDDIMIEPVSRLAENQVCLHAAGGDNECLSTLVSHHSLYGDSLEIIGMTDEFREFWHLNYLLAALGSQMELKRTSSNADASLKMAVEMSYIRSA